MVTILGPTASGKTRFAAKLADRIGGEIISADSRQVYRGMDIGTGKDIADYTVDGRQVRHHLIDIADAGTKYNLFEYQRDFHKAYDDITSRGAMPILCGGTGLYIEAVLKGYALSPVPQDNELRERLSGKTLAELTAILASLKQRSGAAMHNSTDVDTPQRAIRAIEIEEHNLANPMDRRALPAVDSLVVGVDICRDERRRKISERLKQRLEGGMVEEVKRLLDGGVAAEDLIYYGLEYKYVTEYVVGRLSYSQMFEQLEIAIHQFAKRQMTWFRGMERRGTHINWIDASLPDSEKIDIVMRMMSEDRTKGDRL